jgi:hypothetical protein
MSPDPGRPGTSLVAEDRGFEPRRVVTPNRISSVLPQLSPAWDHIRERMETQVKRAGNPRAVRNEVDDAANRRRVRARCVRAAQQAADHPAPPSPGARATMRSIVVLAIPVSR